VPSLFLRISGEVIEQGVKFHEMGRIPLDAEPSSVKADSKRSRSLEAHSGHSSTI
jgi:hypothetical protein